MFDRLASRYDLLNTLLSGGRDASWRRRAADATHLAAGKLALDVACGSGRLTRELWRRAPGGRVVGLDFSQRMLSRAAGTVAGPLWVRADALHLPCPDASFDAVCVAFGLRNFAYPRTGLAEMLRVLKPGGRAVVLEFVRPRPNLAGRLYRAYLRHVLPRVGALISGEARAYRYLSRTVDSYHSPEELIQLAQAAGWERVGLRLMTLGTVGLMSAEKPASAAG